jgi:hypothetical protein
MDMAVFVLNNSLPCRPALRRFANNAVEAFLDLFKKQLQAVVYCHFEQRQFLYQKRDLTMNHALIERLCYHNPSE